MKLKLWKIYTDWPEEIYCPFCLAKAKRIKNKPGFWKSSCKHYKTSYIHVIPFRNAHIDYVCWEGDHNETIK
jgi:hypothetical protein